MKQQKQQTFD